MVRFLLLHKRGLPGLAWRSRASHPSLEQSAKCDRDPQRCRRDSLRPPRRTPPLGPGTSSFSMDRVNLMRLKDERIQSVRPHGCIRQVQGQDVLSCSCSNELDRGRRCTRKAKSRGNGASMGQAVCDPSRSVRNALTPDESRVRWRLDPGRTPFLWGQTPDTTLAKERMRLYRVGHVESRRVWRSSC